jgi:Zn-dependent metalloprotease
MHIAESTAKEKVAKKIKRAGTRNEFIGGMAVTREKTGVNRPSIKMKEVINIIRKKVAGRLKEPKKAEVVSRRGRMPT